MASVIGTNEAEKLLGTDENDFMLGLEGSDVLRGFAGNDHIEGNGQDDRLIGGPGSDFLSGGYGYDRYIYLPGDELEADLIMDGGNETSDVIDASRVERLTLSAEFSAANGIEIIGGASGYGTAIIASDGPVTWDFTAVRLVDIGKVVGSDSADVILGSKVVWFTWNDLRGLSGDDRLVGGDANDRLIGGSGNDLLEGGRGNDLLVGGSGSDLFRGGPGDDLIVFDESDTELMDGGAGLDTIAVAAWKAQFDITEINSGTNYGTFKGIEIIDLAKHGANVLTLEAQDVIMMSGSTNTLRVLGDSIDSIESFVSNWDEFSRVTIDGIEFRQFRSGDAILQVQAGINVASLIGPITVELAELHGTLGFGIVGFDDDFNTYMRVANAGDVNGDGLDDILLGAPYTDHLTGLGYVIFGSDVPHASAVELSALNGGNGFRITGVESDSRSGYSTAGIGDVNGDGFADVLIGGFDGHGGAGISYLVYGMEAPYSSDLDASLLSGDAGVIITGAFNNDRSGYDVAGAGDFNGDGIDDFLIGANGAGGEDSDQTGATYLIFGVAGGFESSIDLGTFVSVGGIMFEGRNEVDRSGSAVAPAGDVNGDGFNDLLIGALLADPGGKYAAGECYVVFGSSDWTAGSVPLSSLDGKIGFRIIGEQTSSFLGSSLSSAGDVNGDGFADIVIGAFRADVDDQVLAGKSYVIFGRAGGFPAKLAVSDLNGKNGFTLLGTGESSQSGMAVTSAGDINGDGLGDILVTAPFEGDYEGAAYVVFGRNGGFPAELHLSSLTEDEGFRILFHGGGSFGRSVASGDFNGDGFDDIVFGTTRANVRDFEEAGSGYVLFGRDFSNNVDFVGSQYADTASGESARDILVGGAGADILNGLGGADVLKGGMGNDRLGGGQGADLVEGDHGDDVISGGLGRDRLSGDGGTDLLDGGGGRDTLVGGSGSDVFRFSTPLSDKNVDRIMDFGGAGQHTLDVIELDSSIFSALLIGMLDESAFESGSDKTADAPETRIVYNSESGALFYDADGSDTEFSAIRFAVIVTAVTELDATDFIVT